MNFKAVVVAFGLAFPAFSYAVETCGGQTSPGNPKICCDKYGNSGGTYGNCVWWAWKKAYQAGWPAATMSGGANGGQWDNYATAKPKLFTIVKTPLNQSVNLKGMIAVRDETTTNPYGHVAYVEDVIKDAAGNITQVKISEMNCGTYGEGVITKNYPLSKFNKFIAMKNLNGMSSSSGGCLDGVVVASTGTTTKLNLYWSNSCQTYWAGLTSTATGNKMLTVKRNWDARSYSTVSSVPGVSMSTPMVINSGAGQVCASASVNGLPMQVCK